MACSIQMRELLNRVIDKEASEKERHELEEHIKICSNCREHYNELVTTIRMIQSIGEEPVPDYFTQKVMAKLPRERSGTPFASWFKRHPLVVAAACFILLMTGYVMSLWNQNSFEAQVQGKGHLVYSDNNTVIVPKGETIKGDLIVKDGKVKIEGKVDGNVILINSDSLSASAGHVSGKIEEVDQILGWIWYHIKQFFSVVFFKGLPVPTKVIL